MIVQVADFVVVLVDYMVEQFLINIFAKQLV